MPLPNQAQDEGNSCLVCDSLDQLRFFEQKQVPVLCNQLLATQEDAEAAQVGDISLAYCGNCGSIANTSFDPGLIDYDKSYDNALHFSEEYQKFANALASRLVDDYKLAGKRVAEIGCGDGYFLKLLLQNGAGSAIGYDPSMGGGRLDKAQKHDALTILPELFNNQRLPDDIDLVVCRHVLEHIPTPLSFLTAIRRTIADCACSLYLEVPNAQWMLESNSIWDVIYEHVTYWTPTALTYALRRAGFTPMKVQTGFNSQYLMIEARPSDVRFPASPRDAVDSLKHSAIKFGESSAREIGTWQVRLNQLHERGGHAALWGAGSKGVTFLNVVPAASEAIGIVVDVNARKHGMFVSGTSHSIFSPDQLARVCPDLILVANEIYLGEIRTIVEKLGLKPEFAAIAR